jgi:anti-anti-sigma factor
LIGELDMWSADELNAASEASGSWNGGIRLDLSELTFIDSSGIHALVKLAKQSSNGSRIVLERPTDTVRKVFEIVGASG